MNHTKAYAAQSATAALAPFRFERRDPRASDVVIAILYCGVCHSDIHAARNEWGGTHYPFVHDEGSNRTFDFAEKPLCFEKMRNQMTMCQVEDSPGSFIGDYSRVVGVF